MQQRPPRQWVILSPRYWGPARLSCWLFCWSCFYSSGNRQYIVTAAITATSSWVWISAGYRSSQDFPNRHICITRPLWNTLVPACLPTGRTSAGVFTPWTAAATMAAASSCSSHQLQRLLEHKWILTATHTWIAAGGAAEAAGIPHVGRTSSGPRGRSEPFRWDAFRRGLSFRGKGSGGSCFIFASIPHTQHRPAATKRICDAYVGAKVGERPAVNTSPLLHLATRGHTYMYLQRNVPLNGLLLIYGIRKRC